MINKQENYSKLFRSYAFPMMIRGVLNSLMHTADRLVAALFIGASALVATTITSPLMYLTNAVSALFIGREKPKKAGQSASGILLLLQS
ncbi:MULTISPECIES: hypothetical protein [unclassified Fusibacter]|uniref:hypothetical protein n=1 Tax=unclassified Fusibacter TaxID=2624464 RepID=UPI0010139B99|nr:MULTISPECIES: hypothetical protein [unclassified Fusibacter]MCK8060322.1 hypothetical protein [Fusibacter sp. A2]NPE20389.1 hypothetical protein [Fusibacter sp. A1]RXV63593.1 hypothetical protein DWB64_01055 [Fusibacter sp. A1]